MALAVPGGRDGLVIVTGKRSAAAGRLATTKTIRRKDRYACLLNNLRTSFS